MAVNQQLMTCSIFLNAPALNELLLDHAAVDMYTLAIAFATRRLT